MPFDAETIYNTMVFIDVKGKAPRQSFAGWRIVHGVDLGRFGKTYGELAYEEGERIVYKRFKLSTDKIFIKETY